MLRLLYRADLSLTRISQIAVKMKLAGLPTTLESYP